jgi:hypothetical protein
MGRGSPKRRSARLPIERDGTLFAGRAHPVKVLDISPSGCLVRCDTLLAPGTIVDLEMRLDSEPLKPKARVTNACLDGEAAPGDPPRYLAGLAFLSLSALEQADLRRFLEQERRRRRSADAPAV